MYRVSQGRGNEEHGSLFKPVMHRTTDYERRKSEYERTGSLTGQIEKPNKFILSFFKSETIWKIYFGRAALVVIIPAL